MHIHGHVGYYVAGMNKHASVTVHGNAGPGAAENMMSGRVHVKGFASTAAGASAHGGLLVIDGDASLALRNFAEGRATSWSAAASAASRRSWRRPGGWSFAATPSDALGDSLYEAVIYVRGKVRSLGADARFEPMSDTDRAAVKNLLAAAGLSHDAAEFKRVASAKSLYHWNADADQEY